MVGPRTPLIALVPFLAALGCSGNAKKIDPDKARAHFNEGVAAAKEGRHKEAVEIFTRALTYHPTFADAYYARGYSYLQLRKSEEPPKPVRELIDRAFADYTSAIRARPAFADAYFSRAMILCSRAAYREAVGDLLVCARYSPKDAEPHLLLGKIYETKFEDKAAFAMKHYAEYVRLGGTDPDIRKAVEAWKKLTEKPAKKEGKKAPTKEEESKALELHERFKLLFSERKEKEALAALEELILKYGHTAYFRERERQLRLIYTHLKKK